MAVKKISVALDPDVVEAVALAAKRRGESLSAWLNDAARAQLRIEDGLAAVAEWETEHGVLTEEELAAASGLLDRVLQQSLRSA